MHAYCTLFLGEIYYYRFQHTCTCVGGDARAASAEVRAGAGGASVHLVAVTRLWKNGRSGNE